LWGWALRARHAPASTSLLAYRTHRGHQVGELRHTWEWRRNKADSVVCS
jgi:hypothetical protein